MLRIDFMDGRNEKTSGSAIGDLWRIISFLKPFKKRFGLLLLIVTVMNVSMLGRPRAIGWGLNHLDELQKLHDLDGSTATVNQVLLYVGIPVAIYLLFGLSTAVLLRIRPIVSMALSVALLRQLRMMVYHKTQKLSFNYLDRLTNGQIIERATGDVTQIQNFLTMSFVGVFDAVVTIIVMLVFMMTMNVELALVALAPLPVVMYLFAKVSHYIRQWSRDMRDQADVMTTRLAEGIAGVRVIRSFGTEALVKEKYHESLTELFRRAMRVFRLRAFAMMGLFRVTHLIEVLLVGYGGAVIIRGRGFIFEQSLGIGDFVAYLFYVRMFIWKVQPLLQAGDSAQVARAAFERITALMDAEPDVADNEDAADLGPGGGRVEFRNVSFAYQDAPHPEADVTERMMIETPPSTPAVVSDVSLTIEAGEVVAFVGPTGAGKSTIVNLLPRFYDPTEGDILIDGQNIRSVRLEDLRKNIGLVFQETLLFRGTIAENIAYGMPNIDREQVRAAARLAQADEFIDELSRGYDSPIGERGVTLSGGQRQRLAIARAILLKPRILILDDATASVDSTTEYRIRQSLKELMVGRTTLIIAHRLPTIRAADRVVVLNDGRIEDIGTHDQLLGRNEFYQTLYNAQMDEQGDAEASE